MLLPAVYRQSVLLCLFTLLAPTATFAGYLSVVPGRSIGRTYLGESRGQVLRSLGPPDETVPSTNGNIRSISGLPMDIWRGKELGPAVFVSYQKGLVIEITTNNPLFKTTNGLSVLSPARLLRRSFKHLHSVTDHDAADNVRSHTYFYDSHAGIAFVNTNGASVFDVLTVYRPGHPVIRDVE